MMQPSLTMQPQSTTETKLAISFRLLLGLYAIIPLCLLLEWSDSLFFGQQLLANLPNNPTHFLLFQIIFGTPHIIASAILVGSNFDYVSHFKTRLIGMTVLIIVAFGLGSLFIPYRVLYITVACWTVYHVLKQQIGVGRGVYRLPEWAFNLLLWLSVLAGIFVYLGIFLNNSLNPVEALWIKYLAIGFTTALIISCIACQGYVTETFGKYFLWVNALLVISSCYFYVQQYYFLAILIPRLIHDATAYIFYVSHDYNRHHQQPQNLLYVYAARCNISIFLFLPLLSFLLTFLLQAYGDQLVNVISQTLFNTQIHKAVTLGLIGYLSLMHYYTESFAWKAGSPLRQFIAFRK